MDSEKDNDEIRDAVLTACRDFMRPLSRYLVRSGVGFKEFSEITKEALVDTVTRDYGIRGRKTNISRVAVLTGLTRKDVSRIRKALDSPGNQVEIPSNRPARVLDAWHHTEGYQGADGKPKPLPFEGDEVSFTSLVRLTGGDIPPRAMLKELIAAGSVVNTSDGRVRAISQAYIPDASEPQALILAGRAIRELMSTINRNLFRQRSEKPTLFQRRVHGKLSHKDAEMFRRLARAQANELLEVLNEWITTYEVSDADDQEKGRTIHTGLGVYLFESDDSSPKGRNQ